MNTTTMDKEFVALVRVSTDQQDVANQIYQIKKKFPSITKVFEEDGVSGSLTRDQRPIFQDAIAYCKKHKATLVVVRLDRLGRNPSDILDFYESEILKGKIDVECLDMPLNEMITPIMVGVSSIERYFIRTRTKEALERIKATIKDQGFYITKDGNKISKLGSPHLASASVKGLATRQAKAELFKDTKLPLVLELKSRGLSLRKIAEELNARNEKTIRGGKFSAMQVKIILDQVA